MGIGPLIGLLALGGLEAARGPIEDRRNRIRGQNNVKAYNRGVAADPNRREGAADTKFNESGAIFYGGGDISADNFLTQRYEQDLQTQQENAAMARQKVASGPAAANAALNARKYAEGKAFTEQQAADKRRFTDDMIELYGTDAEKSVNANPYAPAATRDAISNTALNRALGPQVNPILAEQANLRGPEYLNIDPEVRQEIHSKEAALETFQDTIEYMDNTTAASRLASPEKTAEIMSQFNTISTNALRQYFDAGAMQEADIELFDELRGNPDAWNQMTNAERGKVTSLMKTIQDDLVSLNQSHGLISQPMRDRTPIDPVTNAPMTPVATADIINEAREGAKRTPSGGPGGAAGNPHFGGGGGTGG